MAMRENMGVFRGKRKDNGEWVEGSYLFLYVPNRDWTGKQTGQPEEIYLIVSKSDIPYSVDPETVRECSGVPDRNGKMMFEGDTVKMIYKSKLEHLATVAFNEGSFGLTWMCGCEKFAAFTSICNVEYEIIDNDELLL